MNPSPQPQCPSCGALLSLDDLRGQNCRYCKAALPHHARAAEQAALVNQVLNQQFQARGLPPPGTPVVPYQFGAPPNMPYGNPYADPYAQNAMANAMKSARSSIMIVVIASVAFAVLGIVVAVLLFVLRF
ncbi:MAG: hypothetical protein U0359_13725 [Byssovorax sp.]